MATTGRRIPRFPLPRIRCVAIFQEFPVRMASVLPSKPQGSRPAIVAPVAVMEPSQSAYGVSEAQEYANSEVLGGKAVWESEGQQEQKS